MFQVSRKINPRNRIKHHFGNKVGEPHALDHEVKTRHQDHPISGHLIDGNAPQRNLIQVFDFRKHLPDQNHPRVRDQQVDYNIQAETHRGRHHRP